VADRHKLDWKLIIAIIALAVSITGVFAGSFWRRTDVVFDKRSVEIPLSDSLRKSIEEALSRPAIVKNGSQSQVAVPTQEGNATIPPYASMWLSHLPSPELPDQLLYVNLRNVGHVPSQAIKVRIVVPGQIADKSITDAAAFGTVWQGSVPIPVEK
jgi:hypothetical protein